MKYDFTSHIDRLGWDAVAVDAPSSGASNGFFLNAPIREGFDIIPMWVADMNFPAFPGISEAIIRRAQHPAYGYYRAPRAYYDSIVRWQSERNGVQGLEAEHIGYENGVLGGVVSALKVFCAPADPILLQSPTYIGFTHCIEDNGWNIVLNPMVQDEAGIWRIDFEDLEQKLVKHHIHAAVLCSPHNPTGRVWERWELEKIMTIYQKHDVYVVSDEIWSDMALSGYKHIPTQSVSEDARNRTVALYAPSKTFNLAGLIGSYHIIYNAYLRDRVRKQALMTHYDNMNVLSMHALMGAYCPEGEIWVDELMSVIESNLRYAVDFIDKHFKGVTTQMPQSTYMLFLDCTTWCETHGKTIEELQTEGIGVGVIWQDGRPFHGPCHIRMNLALPHDRVVEAFERLDRYVFNA